MSSFGKNIGYEQDGNGSGFSRPVLVIKKFNNQMFWCVPLSTHQKEIDFYFNYVDPSGTAVSAILAQLKLLSVKRFQRKLYEIDTPMFIEIKEKLINFLL
jgi:mRNA interferase MazF